MSLGSVCSHGKVLNEAGVQSMVVHAPRFVPPRVK